MNDNNKFIAGLLIGAAAGAALILFLTSDKGKELISDVKDGADKMKEGLKDTIEDVDLAVNEWIEKGKSFVNDLEKKAEPSA
jgi:gas vesicle protein